MYHMEVGRLTDEGLSWADSIATLLGLAVIYSDSPWADKPSKGWADPILTLMGPAVAHGEFVPADSETLLAFSSQVVFTYQFARLPQNYDSFIIPTTNFNFIQHNTT